MPVKERNCGIHTRTCSTHFREDPQDLVQMHEIVMLIAVFSASVASTVDGVRATACEAWPQSSHRQ